MYLSVFLGCVCVSVCVAVVSVCNESETDIGAELDDPYDWELLEAAQSNGIRPRPSGYAVPLWPRCLRLLCLWAQQDLWEGSGGYIEMYVALVCSAAVDLISLRVQD